jgi:hypothetical protein
MHHLFPSLTLEERMLLNASTPGLAYTSGPMQRLTSILLKAHQARGGSDDSAIYF